MKTPVDTVKGRIVGYDERTGEVLIRARYDDWFTMCKREYRECLVQMVDGRPLSDRQRRMCYALLREISDYTGQDVHSGRRRTRYSACPTPPRVWCARSSGIWSGS